MIMSDKQKDTMAFIGGWVIKVLLSFSGVLLTILYVQMREDHIEMRREIKQEFKNQGDDINKIKVDMATLKGYVRYSDK